MKNYFGQVVLAVSAVAVGIGGVTAKTLALQPDLYAHRSMSHGSEFAKPYLQAHGAEVSESGDMHSTLEIPAGQPLPTVNLLVHPDSKQGWNLEIETTNFRFAPETVNQSSLLTEGHAHLYIDGVKITRLYGNWYYLESLLAGRHEITVSLNTNDHETLTYQGQPIEATVVLDIP